MGVPPITMFVGAFVLLWAATALGSWLRVKRAHLIEVEGKALEKLGGAVLTLLSLLLGFTFSMAVSRYELRRELEVQEANAIGGLWLRTATLDEPVRSEEQQLVRQYVPARVEFLASGTSMVRLQESLRESEELQARMWAVAGEYSIAHRDPVTAGFLASLSQSVDLSEERTAAFENRIPVIAWVLLLFISTTASLLVGVDIRPFSKLLRLLLPLVVAASLMLIMDLTNPRYGLIHIQQNSMFRLQQQIETSLPKGN